jgi:RHS repeat-associated protein
VITSDLGVIQEESDYYPYGGEIVVTNGDPNTYKFTGKERDAESNLDNFGARYNGSSLGRFETADPLPWLSWQRGNSKDRDRFTAFLGNPENLNLYAYVLNNPLSKTDPTGMYQCSGTVEQCAAIRVGLADIRAAAANLKIGTSGRKALDKVLDFYGAENTNNGVNINFDNQDPTALGSTSTSHGVTTISFGANAFAPLGPTGKGETVAHEGTHGVDQKKDGHMPHTFWQFYDTEYHAYQAESAVDKGVGSPNETDPYPVWFPGITPQQRTTNITKDAYSNACADFGSCQ